MRRAAEGVVLAICVAQMLLSAWRGYSWAYEQVWPSPKPVRYVVATCPMTGFDVQRPIDPMRGSTSGDADDHALVRCVLTSTSASYLPAPLRHLDPTTRGVVERRYTDSKIGARQVRIVVEEVEP